MNLISMIFEIEILIHEFKRESHQTPADINLLFIVGHGVGRTKRKKEEGFADQCTSGC